MPPPPAPLSLNARVADLRGLGRLLRGLPLIRPGSHWNVSRLIERNARRWPTQAAIVFEGRRYTWSDVDRAANRYAQVFRTLGIERGDVVALLMDNRPEFLFALSGLSRLRAISALINTHISGDRLRHSIEVSGAKRVLVGSEHAARLKAIGGELSTLSAEDLLWIADGAPTDAPPFANFGDLLTQASDTALDGVGPPEAHDHYCYIYTSGTTGLPKAAIVPNNRMMTASTLFGRAILNAKPSDVIYCPLPLYHSNGMFAGWGAALASGATLALRRRFSASRFWQDVREYGATRFIYIGELCRYLLNQPPQPEDRDHNVSIATGNGLRPDIWQEFQERFGLPLIREFYGATEGALPIVNFAGVAGRIGRLLPGHAVVRCDVETGEIQRRADGHCERVESGETGLLTIKLAGVSRFDGYLDRSASSKKVLRGVFADGDQYFDSGDLLDVHEGGWLSFADRIGDTYRWKGENVSTNEVAEALNPCPGVLEANVYGVEVPGSDGRAGMAALRISSAFSLDDFTALVRRDLPIFQRPYFLRLQEDMRITGTFKHQKVEYRREAFDPSKVSDPLYFLDGNKYTPVDAALYEAIRSGEVTVR
jgi:acyl-CoA synthetase (AMP-forming)/AMP-acid ligase II